MTNENGTKTAREALFPLHHHANGETHGRKLLPEHGLRLAPLDAALNEARAELAEVVLAIATLEGRKALALRKYDRANRALVEEAGVIAGELGIDDFMKRPYHLDLKALTLAPASASTTPAV